MKRLAALLCLLPALPVCADVDVAVTQVAASTGDATQDITISGFGTPKAAMFFVTSATAAGTAATDLVMGSGYTDGTRESSWSVISEDNLSSTNVARIGSASQCILWLNNSGLEGRASFNSWITDGIRVDWDANPSYAALMTVVLWGGSDLTAYAAVDVHDANVGTQVDFDAATFEPDVVFFGGHTTGFTDSPNSNFSWSTGIASNETAIEQGSSAHVSGDNDSTTDAAGWQHSARVYSAQTPGGESRGLELTEWRANGFGLTKRGSNNSDLHFTYLALNYSGAVEFAFENLDSPTSTGDWAQTGPGFTPQFVFVGLTAFDTADTLIDNASGGANAFGYSIFDASGEYCVGGSEEDGVATTNTQSLVATQAVDFDGPDGTNLHAADFSSLDANGYTLDFTTADGTARKWYALAIEENAGAPAGVFPLVDPAPLLPLVDGGLVN